MIAALLVGTLVGASSVTVPYGSSSPHDGSLSLTLEAERDRYPVHAPVAFWVTVENQVDEPSDHDLTLNLACGDLRMVVLRGSTETAFGAAGGPDLECARIRLGPRARWGVRVVVALDPAAGDFLLAGPGEYRFMARYSRAGLALETGAVAVTAEEPQETELPAYREFTRELARLAQDSSYGIATASNAVVQQGVTYSRNHPDSVYAAGLVLGLKAVIASRWAGATLDQREAWQAASRASLAMPPRGLEREAHEALTPALEVLLQSGAASGEAFTLPTGALSEAARFVARFGGTSYAPIVRDRLEMVLTVRARAGTLTSEEKALLLALERRK